MSVTRRGEPDASTSFGRQEAPIAKVDDLAAYDAIIIGAGTRFGRLPSQMANFLDQAGGLWARGALHGKVGGAFTSSATQHGGQETTLFSIITNLLHFGMVVVGLDYGHAGQMTLDEITGGSPYGATPSPAAMARDCRPRTSSREPATRAAKLPRPQPSCTADAFPPPHRHNVDRKRIPFAMVMARGLGLPHAGRSHRGHGDPVAAETVSRNRAVSRQVPFGPVFRSPVRG
jgi:NAD(P)H:quinone oxidoreductase type IV